MKKIPTLFNREFENHRIKIHRYLETHMIEGIVFHRGNGDMCKIKRSDFGFTWKVIKRH